jgi:hypothetical protein
MVESRYPKVKASIYKWRENNREAFFKYTSEYNSKHREEINRKTKLNYHYKKQCAIFRNILIDEIV